MYTGTSTDNERKIDINTNENMYSYFPNAFFVGDPEILAVFFIMLSSEELAALLFIIDPKEFGVSVLRDSVS
jgi:hypothetical protein